MNLEFYLGSVTQKIRLSVLNLHENNFFFMEGVHMQYLCMFSQLFKNSSFYSEGL